MTRTTAEAAIVLRQPWFLADHVERIEADDWMCETLASPAPAAIPVSTILSDLLSAFTAATSSWPVCDTASGRLDDDQRAVECWWRSTLSGNARVELGPEDLWELFQLVRTTRAATAVSAGPSGSWQLTVDQAWLESLNEPAVAAGG